MGQPQMNAFTLQIHRDNSGHPISVRFNCRDGCGYSGEWMVLPPVGSSPDVRVTYETTIDLVDQWSTHLDLVHHITYPRKCQATVPGTNLRCAVTAQEHDRQWRVTRGAPIVHKFEWSDDDDESTTTNT